MTATRDELKEKELSDALHLKSAALDGCVCEVCIAVRAVVDDHDAALRAEVEEVTLRRSETIAMCEQLRAEIDRLRGERTDDQLHTDNIELRAENERLVRELSQCLHLDNHNNIVRDLNKDKADLTAQLADFAQENTRCVNENVELKLQLATMTQERDEWKTAFALSVARAKELEDL